MQSNVLFNKHHSSIFIIPACSNMAEENPSVTLFREYLRIKSVQPKPDYEGCMRFLEGRAKVMDLPYQIFEPVADKPLFIMTWKGSKPELPSLLLNSHTDVVPVFKESWKCDPFEAIKDDKGDIYARGTQDMKCVAIQHLEAIRRFKEDGKQYERTIHLSFVPDEEIGGKDGMVKLLCRKEFHDLRLGFSLDEGIASGEDSDVIPVITEKETSGGLSLFVQGMQDTAQHLLKNTAAQKAQFLINKLLGFREEQRLKLESNPLATLGDVTSVNLTSMSGGVQANVVPQEFKIGFDIRVTPTTDLEEFNKMINDWCREACVSSGGDGTGINTEYQAKFEGREVTSVAENDLWFQAFKKGVEKSNIKIDTRIFPGGTDSRYLREIGIPAFGFSPMPNTPMLLHDHNERLNENTFIRGIDIFYNIIDAMASAEKHGTGEVKMSSSTTTPTYLGLPPQHPPLGMGSLGNPSSVNSRSPLSRSSNSNSAFNSTVGGDRLFSGNRSSVSSNANNLGMNNNSLPPSNNVLPVRNPLFNRDRSKILSPNTFDPSEFPSLGNRDNAAPNPSLSARPNYVGMVKQPAMEASEFTMSNEDFPALPGYKPQSTSHLTGHHASGGPPGLNVPSSSLSLSGGLNSVQQQSTNKLNNASQGLFFFRNHHGTFLFIHLHLRSFFLLYSSTATATAGYHHNARRYALGAELTTLGLNLNSDVNLYPTFAGPWAETPCRPQDIDYHVPQEYLTNTAIRDKLAPVKLNRYKDDLAAAAELYTRDWRKNCFLRTWKLTTIFLMLVIGEKFRKTFISTMTRPSSSTSSGSPAPPGAVGSLAAVSKCPSSTQSGIPSSGQPQHSPIAPVQSQQLSNDSRGGVSSLGAP
ncbi:ACY1 [Lepeophtheirus salmonis]|uniref:N-acyl-aliphatic-L-amino acid amidohydrolase n=1 Tax=Lepeophtheirus salmonis TaxID=72036 RepID=A0A7R8CYN3_LEPSM|nr:ACY1 [Lepeophtheirus salmonis]CAF2942981.1 ACY1 [Lepeophtheirus salmonis]